MNDHALRLNFTLVKYVKWQFKTLHFDPVSRSGSGFFSLIVNSK